MHTGPLVHDVLVGRDLLAAYDPSSIRQRCDQAIPRCILRRSKATGATILATGAIIARAHAYARARARAPEGLKIRTRVNIYSLALLVQHV